MGERSLVVYCYKEDPGTADNLSFFINHGVCDNPLVEYIFIINDSKCSVTFPKQNNIKLWVRQENEFDLGSFLNLFKQLPVEYVNDFSYFFFINSGCRGPFIPPIISRESKPPNEANFMWLFLFQQRLKEYDVVAPIVEYPPNLIGKEKTRVPFVHSYMFSMNKKGFQNFHTTIKVYCEDTTTDRIETERAIGRNFFLAGLKVYPLLAKFQKVDLLDPGNWKDSLWHPNGDLTCYEIPGNYFGIDVHPYEVIFVKNIRNPHAHRGVDRAGISETLAKQVKNYTEWLS